MKRIAIIPARGGSKRIPRKNIVDFKGKPMIAWTIQAALESGCFDRVLVSTDDDLIAKVALTAGASVPFFRQENSDDHSPVSLATISALMQAEAYWRTQFTQVVQLMPNCPLRDASDVRNAVSHFDESGTSFQISCFRFGWMNPWWAVHLNSEGQPSRLFPDTASIRSQDLAPLYCPTGAIWMADRNSLLSAGSFYGPDHRFFPIDWQAAVDIDDMEDLRMALAVAQMQRRDDGQCL